METYFTVGAIIFCGILWLSAFSGAIRTFSMMQYGKAFGGKVAMFIDSKLMFLGVLHHELSHALLVVLTGGKLKKVCLFKLNTKDGRLGYVEYIGRGWKIYQVIQRGLVAIAPILVGTFTLLGLFHYLELSLTYKDLEFYLVLILISHIACHSAMSKQDWKMSVPALPFLYVLCVLIARLFSFTPDYVFSILLEISLILSLTVVPSLLCGTLFRK